MRAFSSSREKFYVKFTPLEIYWLSAGGKPWDLIQRICFHYMVTLYSMYPVKLVTWAQTLDGAAPAGQFVLKYGRILKLHAALLQPASASSVSFSLF